MDILKTAGVSKWFSGVQALNRVDITIRKGTIHGLIGPNGSGKTTFFNVVTGLLLPSEGKIFWGGKDITGFKPQLIIKSNISRTFQNPRVLPAMTCIENVMLGMHCRYGVDMLKTFLRVPFKRSLQEKEMREKAIEHLRFVGLDASAWRLASELPWVEEQLLQIARAIASEPRLLLLDEPTAGMGAAETNMVRKVIQRVQGSGTTILIVAHDMNLIMGISDWVTVLNFGNKIAEGPPAEIQSNPKVLEAYLGSEN